MTGTMDRAVFGGGANGGNPKDPPAAKLRICISISVSPAAPDARCPPGIRFIGDIIRTPDLKAGAFRRRPHRTAACRRDVINSGRRGGNGTSVAADLDIVSEFP